MDMHEVHCSLSFILRTQAGHSPILMDVVHVYPRNRQTDQPFKVYFFIDATSCLSFDEHMWLYLGESAEKIGADSTRM